jgi:putative transposase
MPRIPERWDGLGQWYFVTVVTLRRHPVFADESACKIMLSAFHEAHHYHPFRLAALVILPDHWHALIRPGIRKSTEAEMQTPVATSPLVETETPPGTQPRPTHAIEQIGGLSGRQGFSALRPAAQPVVIEQVVGAVKKNVLRDLQRKDATIWQTRFLDHRIRGEDDFLHHLEYIRLNPLKHGYATQPDQYGWCFIHHRPFV